MNKKITLFIIIISFISYYGCIAQQSLPLDQPHLSIASQFTSDEEIPIISINPDKKPITAPIEPNLNNNNQIIKQNTEEPTQTINLHNDDQEPLKNSLGTQEMLELYGKNLFENYLEPFKPAEQLMKKENFKDRVKNLLNRSGKQIPGIKLKSSLDKNRGTAYLSNYLEPWKDIPYDQDINDQDIQDISNQEEKEEKIELTFENIDLKQFVDYLANLLEVTFITDGNFDPIPQDGAQLKGNKITFTSHTPLSKKEVWNIGLTFLEIAGFSVVPEPILPRTYRITKSSPTANQEPLPTFIGVNPDVLPNNDSKIRYIYFVNNADLKTIGNIITEMMSTSAGKPIIFNDLRAILLTDKSSNIRSIMSIITELDTVSRPEVLSIVKLHRAEATQIADLFNKELLGVEEKKPAFTFGPPPRKAPTTRFFSDRVRVIAEPRTNALIILGPQGAVSRVEEFITNHIDKGIDVPYSPLHIYRLKHLNTEAIAGILNQLVNFGVDTAPVAAQTGGVRNLDQFFKRNVQVFPEPTSNSLIIKADYEDFLKLKDTIAQLDVEQAQVALKVLILDVDLQDIKEFGTQLRNRKQDCNNGLFGDINFQTSTLGSIVERPIAPPIGTPVGAALGPERLLGNLIQLITGPVGGDGIGAIGETIISLGRDAYGVWGLLRIVENHARTSIIANPFLIATHKYPAIISVGESRRVQGNTVTAVNSVTGTEDESALLTVEVTPIISYDDMVTLNVYISLSNFTQDASAAGLLSGNKATRYVQTSALVADNEVLALGGLIQDRAEEVAYKVPILGDIPILGNLFKFKSKSIRKTSLLILVTPQIIRPDDKQKIDLYTQDKIAQAKEIIFEGKDPQEHRMPLFKWFFGDYKDKEAATIDKFIGRQARYIDKTRKEEPLEGQSNILALNKNNPPLHGAKKSILDLIPHKSMELAA